MIIAICASMQFHDEMRRVRTQLTHFGHTVFIPKGVELMDTKGYTVPFKDEERVEHKIQYDFIREHFRKIEKADAILVLNYDKKGTPHYIGGNTFLEIGLAFWLGKKIFLLHPIPHMEYATEIHAMQPVILSGDITKIAP